MQKPGMSSREVAYGGKEAAAEIVVPGATMSGLYLLSGVGPMELKKARFSNRAACTAGESVQGLAQTSEKSFDVLQSLLHRPQAKLIMSNHETC